MESDERMLVCEGSCNPNLKEYDQVAESTTRDLKRVGDSGEATYKAVHKQAVLVGLARQLVHTRHIPIGDEKYDVRRGWVKVYGCSECGHERKF